MKIGKVIAASLIVAIAGLYANSVQAQTTLSLQNHSFQLPVIPQDASTTDEDPFDTDPGSPPGWTYTILTNPPATLSYGVARPAVTHYGANDPAPAPFDLDQYGFINLNNSTESAGGATTAMVTSDPVSSGALLLANKIYTVRFAVGARNTGSWRDIDYKLVLVNQDGVEVGTTVTQRMDPGVPAVANIQDVVYTLDTRTSAALSSIGKTFRVRLYVINTGLNGTGAFTQANFDNVRVQVDDPPVNRVKDWNIY